MVNFRKSERGQALILIVFGMVGLLGATALAVDGGNAYSDRRHAQNAADTAVMATGLSTIRNPSDWPAAQTIGLARAADNGYNNDGTSNTVKVYKCTDAGSSCTLPAGATDPQDYVQVTVSSTVPTYFARVVGVPQITNFVQAMAKAIPQSPTTWVNGNALVALMPGCKGGGWPNDPFVLGGNSVSLINGSGVFVNSTCDPAFTQSGSPPMTSAAGICVVGGVGPTTNVNPPPQANCGTQVDSQAYALPAVTDDSCPTAGSISTIGPGQYVATPGKYTASFPNVSPAGSLKMLPGIYCLDNGLSLSSGWDLTTDLNGNGTYDGSAPSDPVEGVLFYVPHGDVTFNGGSESHIGAQNKIGTNSAVKGYLIYVPPSNADTVKLTGGNGSVFVGTILAPAALVTLEGANSTDSLTFECQIIGYSVKVTGSGTLTITYDQNKNAIAWFNPILQLYK